MTFESGINISSILIQFQGGFVGQDAKVVLEGSDAAFTVEENIYPEDTNAVQKFKLTKSHDNVAKIHIHFGKSSDFFGRIIIYKLEILS